MNRLDYTELLAEVRKELTMPGGNFEAVFGGGEDILKQAEFIAAVALTAVDRYYSRLTRIDFEIRESGEQHKAFNPKNDD